MRTFPTSASQLARLATERPARISTTIGVNGTQIESKLRVNNRGNTKALIRIKQGDAYLR